MRQASKALGMAMARLRAAERLARSSVSRATALPMADLAERAAVSRSTIRDYEGRRHDIHRATEAQLRLAFEKGGVRFVEIEGAGTGLCLPD
ncbi:transcriptional regulator [Rhizobium etli]